MRDRSSRSPTSASRRSASASITAARSGGAPCATSCAIPLIVVSGVRRSCDTAVSSALRSASIRRSASARSALSTSRTRSTPNAV